MERRPKFKHIHPVFRPEPGIVRLGELFGTAVELDDPNGAIERLCRLMDGTRTIEQLCADMLAADPELTREEISEAVDGIHSLGFLYDAAQEERAGLTERERTRYKGNLNLFMQYANFEQSPAMIQERLKRAKVTILGMGAFGSSLLFNLAGLGVERVRIVDFDKVELSNLNRQMLFNEGDLGRPKIEVAREFMARFHSGMEIETLSMEIASAADAQQAVAGSDLVILSADQPFFVLPHWINQACVKLGVPLIGGGILLTQGTFFSMVPGQTGCLDCMMLHRVERAEDYPQIVEEYMDSRFMPPNSATAPTLMTVTGIIATEVLRCLTGIAPMQSAGRMLGYDFMTLEMREIQAWPRYEAACPTCGHGDPEQPIFRLIRKPEYASRSVVQR
jgi:molybdopterin-synthase adenylyltransferase